MIWQETKSQFCLRSLTPTSTIERFRYNQRGYMIGASGKYKIYSVAKTSVYPVGDRKKIDVNDYMDETLALMKSNKGLTKINHSK